MPFIEVTLRKTKNDISIQCCDKEEPIHKLFDRLNSFELIIAYGDIESLQGSIPTTEWQDTAKASPSRQKEFIAGRRLTRILSSKIGLSDQPLQRASNNAPIWPTGRIGSISHCQKYCAVAVARAARIKSVGIDIELIGRIKRKVWPKLFTKKEQGFLSSLNESDLALATTAVFSAKETLYKFQYSLTNPWVGFQDFEVEWLDWKRMRAKSVKSRTHFRDDPIIYLERIGKQHVSTFMFSYQ